MTRKIITVTILILVSILAGINESYAGQAQAYASVLIIIPPRDEKVEKNTAEKQVEGKNPIPEMKVASNNNG